MLNLLSHEFLWSATPVYYMLTLGLFGVVRKYLRLTTIHFVPFLMLPVAADYVKREVYLRRHPQEYKDL